MRLMCEHCREVYDTESVSKLINYSQEGGSIFYTIYTTCPYCKRVNQGLKTRCGYTEVR